MKIELKIILTAFELWINTFDFLTVIKLNKSAGLTDRNI